MFQSILFDGQGSHTLCNEMPGCFKDLNLNQLVDSVCEKEKNINLAPLYYTPLENPEDIIYRQEILKDLLYKDNNEIIDCFSEEMCKLSELLDRAKEDLNSGDSWKCNYLLYGHFLEYGERYCESIKNLKKKIPEMNLQSDGFKMISKSIEDLCNSDFYAELSQTQNKLRTAFSRERYCMFIKNETIHFKKYEGEENLSEKITSLFKKFSLEKGKSYRREFEERPYADHVEAKVLQCLSRIYPELFSELEKYVKKFSDFIDTGLLNFCREVRFYISWIDEIKGLMKYGLSFCFPKFGNDDLYCNGFFDMVLSGKIGDATVTNDFYLKKPERIFVVTGPNQGGKTTFARAIGQIHYLASLGLNIPGRSAELILPQNVLTHFEREETLSSGNGKLGDDLNRLKQVLENATEKSVIIINEIFSSTVYEDAVKLGEYMIKSLKERGSFCVIVTFLDKLAEYGPETVSLMSTVDSENPEIRTFRIIRKPPDGLAYSMTLADKHGLRYEQILRRIEP